MPYPGISKHQRLGRQQWEKQQWEKGQRERLEALDIRVPYYAASATQSPQSSTAGYHSASVSQNGYSPSATMERGRGGEDANIDPSLFCGGENEWGRERPTYSRPLSFSLPMTMRHPSYTGQGGNEGSTYGSQSDRGNSASLYHGNSGSPPTKAEYACSPTNGGGHLFFVGSGAPYNYAPDSSAFSLRRTDSYGSALSGNTTGGLMDSEGVLTRREDELHRSDPNSGRYSYRLYEGHPGHLGEGAPPRSRLGKRSYDDSNHVEGRGYTYPPPPGMEDERGRRHMGGRERERRHMGEREKAREYRPRGYPPLPSPRQFSAVSYDSQPPRPSRGMILNSHPIPQFLPPKIQGSPPRPERHVSHASPGSGEVTRHFTVSQASPQDNRALNPNKRHPCRFAPPHATGCTRKFTTSGHASRHAKIHLEEKGIECVFWCGFCGYCTSTRYLENAGKVQKGNWDKKDRKDGKDKKDRKGAKGDGEEREDEDGRGDGEEGKMGLAEGGCENRCTKRFTRADNMKQHLETHFRGRGRARRQIGISGSLSKMTGDGGRDEEQREKDKIEIERLLRWGVERREREKARRARRERLRCGGVGNVNVSPKTLKEARFEERGGGFEERFRRQGGRRRCEEERERRQYGATAMDALAYAALGER